MEILASPVLVVMALAVPIGLILEALWSTSKVSFASRVPNICYGVVAAAAEFAFAGIKITIIDQGTRLAGVAGLVDLRLPIEGILGALLSVLLLMSIADFFLYWMHRLQHQIPVLWQEHIVHHCDTEVDVTSTARLHPFSLLLRAILVAACCLIQAASDLALGRLYSLQLYGFVCALITSALFLRWLSSGTDPRTSSLSSGVFRLVGTLSFTLANAATVNDPLSIGIGGLIFVVDSIYVLVTLKARLASKPPVI